MKTYAQELASLPADWTIAPLGSLGAVIGGSTPSRLVPRYWGGMIPWVSPGELTDLKTTYLYETRDRITPEGLASCGTSVLPAHSLLVTTRATIGSVVLTAMPTATNQGFKSIVFRSAVPCFYYYAIGRIKRELERRASGTTFLEISGRDFVETSIAVPQIPEQRQISEILQTVDDAVRRTEQLVEKLKLAKQGLLHNILTRGIDDDGELRDPIRHPEQFKDSPLGRIPCSWEAHPLRSCLIGNPTNGLYKPASQIGRGTIIVGQTSFTDDCLVNWDAVRRAVVTDAEKISFGLRDGDILISRVFATVEGVGLPVLVTSMRESAVFESNMMRVRAHPKRLSNRFLLETLLSRSSRRFISSGANLSNQASINQQVLNALPVMLPPLDEQSRMTSVVEEAEKRLQQEAVTGAKLRLLKQALMDDLLTGRVRVTPLLEKAPTL